ncbi:DNA-binding transcriptional MocR family regulator [Stackebrandtia albiflava]|uniref:DNA-binding transcriptional MocR family regulator n=1 Tax=Stackebrandtia albiflava TaxID=406432 RepID=A0A562UQ59_9ACTN|nr:GntR family transcriptional regulator [Stackebrandtia albiflava]TWJ07749.1 DNA-binding transcriptional MocR family regulator [Stackebrandtia albiflava]
METEAALLTTITRAVTLRTAAALTRAVADLISTGGIPPHARLPTIRAVSDSLGMSRSAVGQAWRELQAQGLVESKRRGGTTVIGQPTPPHAKRYESMIRASITMPVDLGNLWCGDMPPIDLSRAFDYAVRHPDVGNQFAQQITPELRDAVSPDWPFHTESFLATHGAIDALEMSLAALVRPGDRVAVAVPTIARVFDILESLSATPVPIPWEEAGPSLKDLRRALIGKPAAFVYQPNRSLPNGRSVTQEWMAEAAEVLNGTIPVLEMDQTWPLGGGSSSLGSRLPEQVLHTRSFNFAFGADMRQAVVGGNSRLTDVLWNRLSYSSRYVSRIMQLAQAYLLTDPDTLAALRAWDTEIHRRYRTFAEALRRRGHEVEEASPPLIWLRVPDEHSVCTRLSTRGIVVHPGSFFRPGARWEQRISVNAAARGTGLEELADEIAAACDPRLAGGA